MKIKMSHIQQSATFELFSMPLSKREGG